MFIAFMLHTTKNHQEVENGIKQYFKEYLIAYEEKPYEHYHAIALDTNNKWTQYRQNILITQLGLKGRATKDTPRQYGKLKNIEDINKLISYTIKDGEYIKSENFEITEDHIKKSFKKADKMDQLEDLQTYIKNKSLNLFGNIANYSEFKTKSLIVDYIRDETNERISRHKIERLYIMLLNSKGAPFEKSSTFIVEYLFPFANKNNTIN